MPAHERIRCAGIQGELPDRGSAGTNGMCRNDNEAPLGIEALTHRITAVPSGILPVFRNALCLGLSSIALRYTSSVFLLCQRTVPPSTFWFLSVFGFSK